MSEDQRPIAKFNAALAHSRRLHRTGFRLSLTAGLLLLLGIVAGLLGYGFVAFPLLTVGVYCYGEAIGKRSWANGYAKGNREWFEHPARLTTVD